METNTSEGRLWIYQADRILTKEETMYCRNYLDTFCSNWTAHNKKLIASSEIRNNLFVILKVEENGADASGCSIDKSVNALRELGVKLNTGFFGRMQMAYLSGEDIKTIHFNSINEAYENGDIDDNTMFFNMNIDRLSKLENEFLLPLSQHWLGKQIKKIKTT